MEHPRKQNQSVFEVSSSSFMSNGASIVLFVAGVKLKYDFLYVKNGALHYTLQRLVYRFGI